MAVIYKASMTKDQLLEIAVTNGIDVDGDMTKKQITDAIDVFNAAKGSQDGAVTSGDETTPPGGEPPTEGSQDSAEGAKASGDETTPPGGEQPIEGAQDGAEGQPEGYDLFVYAGPTLPRGRLKENAVFRGTFKDVMAYLADVLEEYPQVAKLIVPANRLGAFSVKVKTPGNIAHKYYTDIVSAMHGNKEV